MKPLRVDPDRCIGCKTCLGLGCPPISWRPFADQPHETIKKNAKKQDGFAVIDPQLCNGCTVCQQLCKVGAIVGSEE